MSKQSSNLNLYTNNVFKRRLDLDACNSTLKHLINMYIEYLHQLDFLNKTISDSKANKQEIKVVTHHFNECRDLINEVVSKLSGCRKSHPVMHIAQRYLLDEIYRVQKTIFSKTMEMKKIKAHLINPSFITVHERIILDTNSKEIKKARAYLKALIDWDKKIAILIEKSQNERKT